MYSQGALSQEVGMADNSPQLEDTPLTLMGRPPRTGDFFHDNKAMLELFAHAARTMDPKVRRSIQDEFNNIAYANATKIIHESAAAKEAADKATKNTKGDSTNEDSYKNSMFVDL
ncbi:hypothetical protein SEMRO_209_G087410.1 [Seminavis robusta]|uniref:Uncharacterized protein n=1 Tax=Seminavis robusta TaxID=568900 RepID=A0A9N8DMK3_9STRA|nr:hypothetical protein SEMRO_209_G087410.1 [Seminavis robusta]|eukprot:Sro209_g087410.1 n/a (115) ;mRNA; r:66339-66683